MSSRPSKDKDPDRGNLGGNNNYKRPVETVAFLHHSRVEYNGGEHALVPGHMLPVWDIGRWHACQEFTAISVNAIQQGDRLVARNEEDTVPLNALLEAAKANERLEEAREDGIFSPEVLNDAHFRGRMQTSMLGNIGGVRVVRPDHLPIGVLPMRHRETWSGPKTFHHSNITMWEWIEHTALRVNDEVQLPVVRREQPPEICFFVRDRNGSFQGWDTQTEEIARFKRVPLPFTWQSAEDFKLIDVSEDAPWSMADQASQLAMAMSANVRRLWLKDGWAGSIYVGIHDPRLTEFPQKRITVQQVQDDWEYMGAIYSLPYIPANPWQALERLALDQARALLVGTSLQGPVTTSAGAQYLPRF